MTGTMEAKYYERLAHRLPGMVWMLGLSATGEVRWLHLSDRLLEVWAIDRKTVETDPNALTARVHPDDRAAWDKAAEEAIRDGKQFAWRGRIIRPDGTVRWLESTAMLEPDPVYGILWYGQSFDHTEAEQARQALVESERARAESERTMRAVIEAIPISVAVIDAKGNSILYNSATRKLLGGMEIEDGIDELQERYQIYELDGVTPVPSHEVPIARALQGVETLEREIMVRPPSRADGAIINTCGIPLRRTDGTVYAALAVSHDITQIRGLEREIRQRNADLQTSEEAKSALIERLRYAVDELSTPLLEVWDDVLVVPLIGVIDSRRVADLVQKLLEEVTRSQAQSVIVDLTGVDLVDTKTADHLIKLVRKVELVGASCVLTGIQPNVAQTLVDIGVDFGRLSTLRSLKHGLRASLQRMGEDARASTAETRLSSGAQ